MNKVIEKLSTRKQRTMTNTLGVATVIILLSLFLMTQSGKFISHDNIITIFRVCSVTILVGFAQMVVIAGGGLNVSVGAIGGLAAVIVGAMIQRAGIHWGVAILIALMIGACCGAFNGLIITGLGATGEISWLTTLATMSVFTGITLTITKANPFYNLPHGFDFIGIYNFFNWIPLMIVFTLIFTVLLSFMFKSTSFGRQVLAIGGNQKAAELSGINVKKVIIIKHMISAFIASFAGILFATRLGSIGADIGQDWMLFSFAAPLIGGTRMEGGRVDVVGAFLGGLLLAVVSNGVVHMEVNVYIVEFLEGIIILLAVGVDRLRSYREEQRERRERAAL